METIKNLIYNFLNWYKFNPKPGKDYIEQIYSLILLKNRETNMPN